MKRQTLRQIQFPDACGSLEDFFSPRSVAVIGASRNEAKLGHAVLSNIVQSGFAGAIYAINPSADEILGLPCYPDINAVEGPIDLVVVVVPAKSVLEILESCGKQGVKATIVITAGFRETGHDGLMAEQRMGEIAETYGMRILGPNCLGLIDTLVPINASFAAGGGLLTGVLCTFITTQRRRRSDWFTFALGVIAVVPTVASHWYLDALLKRVPLSGWPAIEVAAVTLACCGMGHVLQRKGALAFGKRGLA